MTELVDKWQDWLFNKYPDRSYTGLVVDLSGRFVLATRYLRPIKPPDEVMKIGTSWTAQSHMAARYVRLMPYMSDALTFQGLCDIWSTAEVSETHTLPEDDMTLLCIRYVHIVT